MNTHNHTKKPKEENRLYPLYAETLYKICLGSILESYSGL